ncbi:nucleotide-binding domain containing protein [Halomonas alkaliantarctica]
MAGAAGLATAIAQHFFGWPDAPLRALSSVNAVLYAIGSRSPRAAGQFQQLRQHVPGLAVIKACTTPSATSCHPSNSSPALNACAVVPGESDEHTANQVAESIAANVADITSAWRDDDACLLFLTGGDIAMAVLTQLGMSYISVETEWSPGVALGSMDGDRRKRVMTKAGGFGDPQLLVRLHHQVAMA